MRKSLNIIGGILILLSGIMAWGWLIDWLDTYFLWEMFAYVISLFLMPFFEIFMIIEWIWHGFPVGLELPFILWGVGLLLYFLSSLFDNDVKDERTIKIKQIIGELLFIAVQLFLLFLAIGTFNLGGSETATGELGYFLGAILGRGIILAIPVSIYFKVSKRHKFSVWRFLGTMIFPFLVFFFNENSSIKKVSEKKIQKKNDNKLEDISVGMKVLLVIIVTVITILIIKISRGSIESNTYDINATPSSFVNDVCGVNSYEAGDGNCECLNGYEWINDDPENLDCKKIKK